MLYACDDLWWERNIDGVRRDFHGECWTQAQRAAERFALNWVCGRNADGFSEQPGIVHNGLNSGFQVLNLLHHWKPAKVILLGYDFHMRGGVHWHGKHSGSLMNPDDNLLKQMVRYFDTIQPLNYPVINCSPDSQLRRFPKSTLEQALATS